MKSSFVFLLLFNYGVVTGSARPITYIINNPSENGTVKAIEEIAKVSLSRAKITKEFVSEQYNRTCIITSQIRLFVNPHWLSQSIRSVLRLKYYSNKVQKLSRAPPNIT